MRRLEVLASFGYITHMITKKTVLVLGAGSSADYGFPVGSKLKEQIIALDTRGSSSFRL